MGFLVLSLCFFLVSCETVWNSQFWSVSSLPVSPFAPKRLLFGVPLVPGAAGTCDAKLNELHDPSAPLKQHMSFQEVKKNEKLFFLFCFFLKGRRFVPQCCCGTSFACMAERNGLWSFRVGCCSQPRLCKPALQRAQD